MVRAPSIRVVLVGLAVAAVFVGGSLATRHGPIGGRGAESGAGASRATDESPAPTTSRPTLGSVSEQLARLPLVEPGELAGVLDVANEKHCSLAQVDLGTLSRRSTRTNICSAPGARCGIRDGGVSDTQVDGVDLDGRRVETVPVPRGWFFSGLTRRGIVFCDDGGDAHGRLR